MATAGRLHWYEPAELSDQQREVYDAIITGPRSGDRSTSPLSDGTGRLHGPFNAMLVSPRVGGALQAVGSELRYGTELTGRQREIAILLVAADERSSFEWLAHENVARALGVTEDELSAVLSGSTDQLAEAGERAVADVVRALLDRNDLTDHEYAHAVHALGSTKVVELVTLVGYYRMLSLSLRVFRVPLPDGATGRWSDRSPS